MPQAIPISPFILKKLLFHLYNLQVVCDVRHCLQKALHSLTSSPASSSIISWTWGRTLRSEMRKQLYIVRVVDVQVVASTGLSVEERVRQHFVAIPKCSQTKNLRSYHPISLLSILRGIVECFMHYQRVCYTIHYRGFVNLYSSFSPVVRSWQWWMRTASLWCMM